MQEILICYEGSHGAERVIDAAVALLAPRHAVVLNVSGGAFEDVNRAEGLRRAEGGAAHARPTGLDAEARATIASTTRQGIIDVADELDAAAIVIGSRGLGGLREFARGSVAHDVATTRSDPR